MPDTLIDVLLKTGMIQTGYFIDPGQPDRSMPIGIHLKFLPAYPDVLAATATAVASQMVKKVEQQKIERLICSMENLPLATAVSLATRIPLVYSRGQGESPGYDLVGAYDVGHPALLITNVLDAESRATFSHLQSQAAKVGLELKSGLALIGFHSSPHFEVLITVHSLLDQLMAKGQITAHQRDAILHYLKAVC